MTDYALPSIQIIECNPTNCYFCPVSAFFCPISSFTGVVYDWWTFVFFLERGRDGVHFSEPFVSTAIGQDNTFTLLFIFLCVLPSIDPSLSAFSIIFFFKYSILYVDWLKPNNGFRSATKLCARHGTLLCHCGSPHRLLNM